MKDEEVSEQGTSAIAIDLKIKLRLGIGLVDFGNHANL